MSKKFSAKYYQENKERLQKNLKSKLFYRRNRKKATK